MANRSAPFGMSTEEILQLTTAWAQLELAETALTNAHKTLGKMSLQDLPVRSVKERMREMRRLGKQIVDLVDVKDGQEVGREASHGGDTAREELVEKAVPASAIWQRGSQGEVTSGPSVQYASMKSAATFQHIPEDVTEDEIRALHERFTRDTGVRRSFEVFRDNFMVLGDQSLVKEAVKALRMEADMKKAEQQQEKEAVMVRNHPQSISRF